MSVDDSFTKSLLHFDGVDASTTFTDESGKIWTTGGTAQLDTAQSKFGMASGLFAGSINYITTPDHADFNVGANNFTVDFWFKKTAGTGSYLTGFGICDSTTVGTNSSMNFLVDATKTGVVQIQVFIGTNTNFVNGTTLITDTNWHHVAAVRNTTTLALYQDGVLQGTSNVAAGTINNSSRMPTIGRLGDYTAGYYMHGWIDEFRFSNGTARWTSNFTPPTSAYGISNPPRIMIF